MEVAAWISEIAFPVFHYCRVSPTGSWLNCMRCKRRWAIVEYYLNCWNAYLPAEDTPPRGRHFYAAHETLREARDIIDGIVEKLRIQVAGITLDHDEKQLDE